MATQRLFASPAFIGNINFSNLYPESLLEGLDALCELHKLPPDNIHSSPQYHGRPQVALAFSRRQLATFGTNLLNLELYSYGWSMHVKTRAILLLQ